MRFANDRNRTIEPAGVVISKARYLERMRMPHPPRFAHDGAS
jgi:hypothetical protein